MKKTEHSDELQDSPILGGMKKRDPFVVPELFFERFPHKVQARIAGKQDKQSGQRPWETWILRFSLAGTLGALLLVAFWKLAPGPSPRTEFAETPAPIMPEELLESDLESDLLWGSLNEEEPLMNTVALSLTEREMTAYMEHEDLALELLIEEL